MRGRMMWFNAAKGFGFIETDDGERVRVHESGFAPGEVPVGRCARTLVSFERIAEPEGSYHAVGVSVVEEVPARRARSRRHSFR